MNEIERLRAENKRLENEVFQLQEALGMTDFGWIALRFKLSKTEAAFLAALTKRPFVSMQSLQSIAEFINGTFPETSSIRKWIKNLRDKLAKHQIIIETQQGLGFYVDEETRDQFSVLRQEFRERLQAG